MHVKVENVHFVVVAFRPFIDMGNSWCSCVVTYGDGIALVRFCRINENRQFGGLFGKVVNFFVTENGLHAVTGRNAGAVMGIGILIGGT